MGASEESHPELVVQGSCSECGGPFRAGIWDHSFHCEYCGSLLLSKRELGGEVFVVSSGRNLPVLDVIIARESDELRSRLRGRYRLEDGVSLELPALVEAKVKAFQAELRASLELVETIDFFAPYEVREQTVMQGILGRRRGRKESFLQAFLVEELARLYDTSDFNLRDRGLKIRGLELQLMSDAHFGGSEPRFLEAYTAADFDSRPDRTAFRVRADTQIISRIHDATRERRLRVYKHMSYACVRRNAAPEHYLIDRQFDGIAGRPSSEEAKRFRALPPRPISQVLVPPDIRAIASQCPNCGWELELPSRESIVFCPTCWLGVSVTPEGLQARAYRAERAQAPGRDRRLLYFPFWAFPFRVRVENALYTRVWDWLTAVSPQPLAEQFRETDPPESTFFLPARQVFGSPELDDVFAQLTGWVNWRQPELYPDRLLAAERTSALGVELSAAEAWKLARFALLALHDDQSTRRLNGRSFGSYLAEAEPLLGSPFLALVALVGRGEDWDPGRKLLGSSVRGFPLARVESSAATARLTKSFNLA